MKEITRQDRKNEFKDELQKWDGILTPRSINMIHTIKQPVINIVWEIVYRLRDDNKVEILKYDRANVAFPKTGERVGKVEGKIAIKLATYLYNVHPDDEDRITYVVANPRSIFSYR